MSKKRGLYVIILLASLEEYIFLIEVEVLRKALLFFQLLFLIIKEKLLRFSIELMSSETDKLLGSRTCNSSTICIKLTKSFVSSALWAKWLKICCSKMLNLSGWY
ncbi:hypothetical protein C7B80_20375 [Cyanosarcina cf. burmensis CCALA 770]|nr:hypothetical protein C7B80_20375 [Cyanosarcina cf. burmensis CCALA 770]